MYKQRKLLCMPGVCCGFACAADADTRSANQSGAGHKLQVWLVTFLLTKCWNLLATPCADAKWE